MDPYLLLDSALGTIVSNWNIAGLSVGIVKADRSEYTRYFGVKNISTGAPVDRDTIFCIASASKCFVATAITQLVERGSIDLDVPIQWYLPDFTMDDDRCRQITVRHLLCHMSGLPDMDEDEYDIFLADSEDDQDASKRYVAGLQQKRLIATPGERFSYSNIGYNVLGYIIAKVSGIAFEDYMRDHILLQSGMPSSTFSFPEIEKGKLAVPHILIPALAVRPSYPYHRADAPASFLHTTLPDMLNWCRVCLDAGKTTGQRILSSEGYKRMWTPAIEWGFPPLYEFMGLGWTLGHYKGAVTVSHGGMGLGWAAFLTILPEQQCAAFLLCNAETHARSRIIRALLDVILGQAPVSGTISWVVPLSRAYLSGGIQAVYETYHSIRLDNTYSFDPEDMINLAHQLHSAGNDQTMNEILTFSLSVYPDCQETRRMLQKHQISR